MSQEQGDVLLIGSVGLEDTEAVFRTLAKELGNKATRYPDGETGERGFWIVWQHKFMAANKNLVVENNRFRPRDGLGTEDLTFDNIGYADAALESWEVFRRLKAEGVIGKDIRFQISLPTPAAVVSLFVQPDHCTTVEPAYEAAMIKEMGRIMEGIPAEELAIQWDVCLEILAFDEAAGVPMFYEEVLEGTMERLARLNTHLPESVEMGVHLCYGDPGHKHIKEPESALSSVLFCNAMARTIKRRVDWMHFPCPKDRNDDAYYKPLEKLDIPKETRLYIGLVHYTDGHDGTMDRVSLARKYVKDFGVATECGFGRRERSTIPKLLKIHTDVVGTMHR